MTAAHAPGDQPPLHRRDQSADEGSVARSEFATLSEARLAATCDLLNVAKALLTRWRHNLCVIAGQTASFQRILPLRMPLRGASSPVLDSNSLCPWP